MEYYVGLDVSLKQTSICVVDQSESVVREGVVDSDPEAISVYARSKAPGAGTSRTYLLEMFPWCASQRPDKRSRSSRRDRSERRREGGTRRPVAIFDFEMTAFQRWNRLD
jgi:hypothetical protein